MVGPSGAGAGGNEDVPGLDVAVPEATRVGGVEGGGDLARDRQGPARVPVDPRGRGAP